MPIQFVNLTKHNINILLENGNTLTIPPSGTEARVSSQMEKVNELNGIPVVKTTWGDVVGLPDPQPDTVYIVSMQVLQALKGARSDLVGPDTSPSGVVRDENGNIVGVKGFQIV